MAPKKPPEPNEFNLHLPNQTTTDATDPNLPPPSQAIRPREPVHRKPRIFIHRPIGDEEEEAAARANTSYIEGLRTLDPSEFATLHTKPCVRDAMLPGIGGGVGVGALRFVMGASVMKSCNWAVAVTVLLGVGGYEMCQRRRRWDKDGIRQALKVLDEKQKMDARAAEEEEAEARKAEAGRRAAELQERKPNFWSTFKFW